MARHPYAARTLAQQVRDHLGRTPDSKAGRDTMVASDDPDGLGVHRTFKFDKVASRRLKDVLTLATLDDPRIDDVYMRNDHLYVRFSGRTIADSRDPFPLDEAVTVSAEGDDAEHD